MARLPRFPETYRVEAAAHQLPDLAEFLGALAEWGTDLTASQQRYNQIFFSDYQSRRSPPETPKVLSAQLNTTLPLHSPNPPGRMVFVSDASGGGELAFGDTSTWRLVRNKSAV